MKKVFSLLITLAMLISTVAVPMSVSADTTAWDGTIAEGFAGGDGSEENPYLISNGAELAYLAESVYTAVNNKTDEKAEKIVAFLTKPSDTNYNSRNSYNVYTGKYFKLTADIDLGSIEWTPIGRYGARFDGVFDGNGHIVKNIKISKTYHGVGFFGATGKSTVVKNLGLEEVSIAVNSGLKAEDYTLYGPDSNFYYLWGTGSMVGIANGKFESCYVKNTTLTNASSSVGEAGLGGFMGNALRIDSGARVACNNCYVMNPTIGGYNASVGFASVSDNNGYENTERAYTNCYVGGTVNLISGSRKSGFLSIYYPNEIAVSVSNCYTVSDLHGYTDLVTETSTKQDIKDGMRNISGYMEDDPFVPINDGYPILSWQSGFDVWDGTTDTDWVGKGTADEPYLLTTAAELAGLAKIIDDTSISAEGTTYSKYDPTHKLALTGKYYKLTTDVDLNEVEWLPIGRIGVKFDGNFDGDGHVIKNLKMTNQKQTTGLFGSIGENAHVWNVGVDGIDIQTKIGGYNEHTDELYHDTSSGRIERCLGFGGLVGQMCPAATANDITIKNCYVKNVLIKPTTKQMGVNGMGALVGNVLSVLDVTSANRYNKFYISDCYVENVELWSHSATAPIVGGVKASNYTGSAKQCYQIIRNCYVKGDVKQYRTTNANPNGDLTPSQSYNFANVGGDATQCAVTNCFTSTNAYNDFTMSNATDNTQYPVYTTDALVVAKALVTGDDRWALDCVEIPTNDGYPVLGWERAWTVANYPLSWYKGAGVTVADGNVTAITLIQSDADVEGEVIVAVYGNDGRFKGAVTAAAAAGVVALETPIAVVAGDDVKVLVWGAMSTLNPLATVYSTTIQ